MPLSPRWPLAAAFLVVGCAGSPDSGDAPRALLTAAHCFALAPRLPLAFTRLADVETPSRSQRVAIASWFLHPAFDPRAAGALETPAGHGGAGRSKVLHVLLATTLLAGALRRCAAV
jgi:hypothetical protein